MDSHRVERLRQIKSFPSLVKYLRDDLDWPIEVSDFDELTFDYEPDELGIDKTNAAKIQEIKQLRPLAADQPYGIFFLKFEPKHLPVVVLRRILSQLVIKKRASGRRADQPAWHLNDLLFISNYGDQQQRQITFAQFANDETIGDLPVLRVLGWDDADTFLHLDHVDNVLTEKLRWPRDDSDANKWRTQWSSAFVLRHREVITTSKQLSLRLAELAKRIRNRAKLVLAVEAESGVLRKLHKSFKTALIHDLSEDDFADMYAQTIAYGLLAARVSRPVGITADNLTDLIPITNPFLKEMLSTFLKAGGRKGGIDFDELGVQDVVDLLNDPNTHIEDIMREFGNRTRQEDPVINFYEFFLKEYNKKKKIERGVFYTPQPVVSYIVRSVDELLRTEFGLEDGLADTTTWGEMVKRVDGLTVPEGTSPDQAFVQILDPATGTGTFLVEVIDVIYTTMAQKWKRENRLEFEFDKLWNEYVPKYLLPRLYGYELLMAPYAIAHLKIGLKLFETGYRFGSDERTRIYLTNALEPASPFANATAAGLFEALGHEAQAVNEIKRKQRFTVVIGNPPYSGESANASESPDGAPTFIGRILRDYFYVDGQPLRERNSKWLHDDYVKFIRFGEYIVTESTAGVLGYITNHSFVFNPTFRGMRQHLLQSFNRLDVLNLHGNLKLREQSPDGSADINVFEIEPGVAITLGLRRLHRDAILNYGDLWGSSEQKCAILGSSRAASLSICNHVPAGPFYLLFPQEEALRGEYLKALPLTDVFPLNNTGIITKRDGLTIHFSGDDVWHTVQEFAKCPPAAAYKRFDLPEDVRDWSVARAQADLRSTGLSSDRVCHVHYRPFDVRFSYYTGNTRGFIGWPVDRIMQHMVSGKNLALCIGRAGQVIDQGEWDIVFVSRYMTEFNLFRRGGNVVFPAYLYSNRFSSQQNLQASATTSPNLSKGFLTKLIKQIGGESIFESGLPESVLPEDVTSFAYAIFYSHSYRARYAEFLRIDFPRLPLPATMEVFRDIVHLGRELVALHLMESPKLDHLITTYTGPKNPEVEKVGWSDDIVWLNASATKKGQPSKPGTIGFHGVPEAVWNFHIGGYQVCEKWLKDRKGRTLSKDDIAHYQKIVVALSETIRLMAQIDKVIDKHGGWPGAFK